MSALAELDTAPQTIEPTVNYLVNDGTEVFTYTGGAGSLDVRTGGAQNPQKVVMQNGRPHVNEFNLDVDGFRFVRHDTKVRDFYDADEIRSTYYAEMEALVNCSKSVGCVIVNAGAMLSMPVPLTALVASPPLLVKMMLFETAPVAIGLNETTMLVV